MDVKQLLFALLRHVICGQTLDAQTVAACTPEKLEEVCRLAGAHDLAHLAGQAVSGLELPPSEGYSKCKNAALMALFRYTQSQHEYTRICQTLADAKIPFIPLKGAVVRDLYPQPWMRTSSDLDILVREETLEAAAEALVAGLQYRSGVRSGHDISLFSASGVHLELHFAAIDEGKLPETVAVLDRIWSDARPTDQPYHYYLSDEMFYFYHISHMAKHFESDGCGIRPCLDLWILRHRTAYDEKKREELLAEGGMLSFARAVEKLAEVWFSGAEADLLTQKLEDFMLKGVSAGSEQLVAVRQTKSGSKLRYLWQRLFLPYDVMCYRYPIVQKHKWLMPVYQVVRWVSLPFSGRMGRSVAELKASTKIGVEQIQTTRELLEYLGL